MMTKKLSFFFFFSLTVVLLVIACSHDQKAPSQTENETKPITITDRTGKVWDITHAVEKYNFEPKNFNYGLGPNAIKPINFPEMLVEGETGYPAPASTRPVIGVQLNGEERAYPVEILAHHEVVNERIVGADVAVNY